MSIRCLQERSMICLLTELTGLKCASLVAGLQYYHIMKRVICCPSWFHVSLIQRTVHGTEYLPNRELAGVEQHSAKDNTIPLRLGDMKKRYKSENTNSRILQRQGRRASSASARRVSDKI